MKRATFPCILGDLADLMQEIILEARKLTGAERCSLFLLSEDGKELVAKVKK